MRLARAVGIDLDSGIVGRSPRKRAAILCCGTAHGGRPRARLAGRRITWHDRRIHHGANMARMRSLAAAQEMLATALVDRDQRFFAALEAGA